MPTETQKNFKKQMKEIQRELSQNDKEQFFSYIEDNHIESYYKPKSKRKVAAISIGSIIPLIWLGYCTYTWVKPIVKQISPSSAVHSFSSMPSGELNIFDKKQAKIIKYLDEVRHFDDEITKVIGVNHKDFNNTLKNRDLKTSFLEVGSKNKTIIEDTILAISKIYVPEEMKIYHDTVKEKYDTVYENVIYCIDTVKSGNTNNNSQINFLVEKYNLLSKQQTEQMILVFDKTGIKYQQDSGSINYWYNK